MKMRVGRLIITFVILLASIVPAAHALLDAKPNGYVDDLSWMPTPQSANAVAQDAGSMQYKIICAASAATIGFFILYIADAGVRDKVHAWLGLKAKSVDTQNTPAV
jgi:hypothetical protein